MFQSWPSSVSSSCSSHYFTSRTYSITSWKYTEYSRNFLATLRLVSETYLVIFLSVGIGYLIQVLTYKVCEERTSYAKPKKIDE